MSFQKLKKDDLVAWKYRGGTPYDKKAIIKRIYISQVIYTDNTGIRVKDLKCINDTNIHALDDDFRIMFNSDMCLFLSKDIEGDSIHEQFPEYFI